MEFEVLTKMRVDTFHSMELQDRSGYLFLPLRDFAVGTMLVVEDFGPTAHLKTNFSFGSVSVVGATSKETVGILLHSKLPVYNYSTAAMSYSMSWQKSVEKVSIGEDDTSLVFKSDLFYVYEVPTIATLVTCGDLSPRLHSYLTMITLVLAFGLSILLPLVSDTRLLA